MDRRRFLLTSLASAFAAPSSLQAQPAPRVPRLGVLVLGSPETSLAELQAFRQGLRERGYVEGQNITFSGIPQGRASRSRRPGAAHIMRRPTRRRARER